jgi:hypothetical protein
MQHNLEVPFLLHEWGRWARHHHGLRLGYRRVSTTGNMRGGGMPCSVVSDAVAQYVDAAVAQVTPERARDAVVLRYCVGASQRRIAEELGCCRQTVQRLVDLGMQQVGEALEG